MGMCASVPASFDSDRFVARYDGGERNLGKLLNVEGSSMAAIDTYNVQVVRSQWFSVYVKFFDGTNRKLRLSQVLVDSVASGPYLRHGLGPLKRVSYVVTPQLSGYKVFAVLFVDDIVAGKKLGTSMYMNRIEK
jgi:hypothetical protein